MFSALSYLVSTLSTLFPKNRGVGINSSQIGTRNPLHATLTSILQALTSFLSASCALFLSQRGCRGVALVFLTKGISKGTIGLPNQNPGLPLLSSRSARLEFTPVISTGAQPSSSLPNIEREPLSARSGTKKNQGSRRPQRRESHAQRSRCRFQQLPQQLAPGVKAQRSPVKIPALRIRVAFIVRLRSSRQLEQAIPGAASAKQAPPVRFLPRQLHRRALRPAAGLKNHRGNFFRTEWPRRVVLGKWREQCADLV